MDIHRSRFVPYPPSAINALAFSHPEVEHGSRDPESLRLAVGRANGNIEIWNPANGTWLQEKVFFGGKDRSVEGLVWTQEPDQRDAHNKIVPGRLRLFSIGYSSSVTEWDLTTGLPARHSDGNHSDIWCFAAQPRRTTKGAPNESISAHQKLIVGCADGTIVLLSTDDNDLRFERVISRATKKNSRVLSIAYKDSNTILAGFGDSAIRVFDVRNGNCIKTVPVGGGPVGGPKETLVWKVKCLPNGDFVSGDSTGDIRIHNGRTYDFLQAIHGHEADIMDLAVSRDGKSIFSVGMDRRTCFYTSVKTAATKGKGGLWRKVSHQRYHEHDVKALATYEGNKLSVVVSGGIDTQPIIVPLRQFGKELSRGLPALPHTPPLVSAPDARLVVSWWNSELRIWRVKPQDDGPEKPKVVARLALQGEENITSVSISRDGGLLAVGTITVVKLFQLIQPQTGAGLGLRIRKLEMPSIVGAKNVRLTANGKWLAAITATDTVQLVRIVRTDDSTDQPRALSKVQHLHRLPRDTALHSPLNGPTGSYDRAITHAEFSSDANILAVADLAGYIDTWVIEGNEDSTAPEIDVDDSASADAEMDDSDDEDEATKERITFSGQRWISNPSAHVLPRLDSTPVLLSFQPCSDSSDRPEPNGNPAVHPTRQNPHPHSHELPSSEQRLMLVSAEHQLYLFEVMAGRLSEWSRRNPPSSYPSEYRQLDLPAKGCVWDVNEARQRIWLYGEKWLFMFDLTKDFPISDSDDMAAGKKRKRDLIKDTSKKSNSGAGDVMPQKEIPVTKMRKFNSAPTNESRKVEWVDVDATNGNNTLEEDDEDKTEALAALRRSTTQDGVQVNGESTELVLGGEAGEIAGQRHHSESSWHTFKYRPILGIVPIGVSNEQPEVVLVERPSWDLDLPPRFVGAHER